MSFSGHVFDMIRRSKEYRDMHNLRRERSHGTQSILKGKGKSDAVGNSEIRYLVSQQTSFIQNRALI